MVKTALADAVLDHLLAGGRIDGSLRSLAAGSGVGHPLLLYHFGSREGVLTAAHRACEQRQREHLAALAVTTTDPLGVMRAMWAHLAAPDMWPVYRLGFALRATAGSDPSDPSDPSERDEWLASVRPLVDALGTPAAQAPAEAFLWLATCRGLLWELVTGAEPAAVDAAAERFFTTRLSMH